MNISSDPFAGIPDTSSDYAGTELETTRERADRIAREQRSPAEQHHEPDR